MVTVADLMTSKVRTLREDAAAARREDDTPTHPHALTAIRLKFSCGCKEASVTCRRRFARALRPFAQIGG
jgi:hypothetical protein